MYVLLSPYFTEFMTSELRGIAYKGLNMGILSLFPVPLPPLDEQNCIVSNIEKIEQSITKLEKKENKLNTINLEINKKGKTSKRTFRR